MGVCRASACLAWGTMDGIVTAIESNIVSRPCELHNSR